ncbi:MAG TPA: hypothetical protein VK617_16975 [Gemmatimonadaceae bacterium]|jgi:hypothetical protein|nr:hypothetical protein [Gemmatimonadaceae bacterium]
MSEAVFIFALSMVCGSVVLLGAFWFLRRALELKHERRLPIAFDGLQERLDRIEQTVEATAVEVERISEGNRFMSKLLADRAGAMSLASKPERVITPH